MKILVINTGSSSIKYQLFDMDTEAVLATGMAEKIGETMGILTHRVPSQRHPPREQVIRSAIRDHREGLSGIVDLLVAPGQGVIRDPSDIAAVGHRVVHGGETFHRPVIINDAVIGEIKKNASLAPLHNPPNLTGIMTAKAIFPGAPQVAVFDTAFHQTLPPEAYLYALPYDLYEKHHIRRYGFHGTSHAYVSENAAIFMKQPLGRLNLITLHLGNGASMAAIRDGKCADTSMGLTPLEGLVMGTRTGDMDPAVPLFLSSRLNMPLDAVNDLMNKKSGLKGICGVNDMRTILERAGSGDERAQLALDIYTYRIRKYIGAYAAILGRLDSLVFTGGIGENSSVIREKCCRDLSILNIEIDPVKNALPNGQPRDISLPGSAVRVLVIPTNEELKIARETLAVIKGFTEAVGQPT